MTVCSAGAGSVRDKELRGRLRFGEGRGSAVVGEGTLRPCRRAEGQILEGLRDIGARGRGVHVGRAGGCVTADVVVEAVAGCGGSVVESVGRGVVVERGSDGYRDVGTVHKMIVNEEGVARGRDVVF